MQGLLNWLKGKKVYLLAVSAIIAAFAGWVDEQITTLQMIQAIWLAIVSMAGRAAISKVK